jgi:elongation factor P hydroxylase
MLSAPSGYYVASGDNSHYHLACDDCGVLVDAIDVHNKWCPAKEHDRKMADYGKVYGKQVADGLREYALRKVAEDLAALSPNDDVYNPGVPLDHKEP